MPIPTGLTTGVGSVFVKEVTKAIAALARFVPAAGWYYVYAIGADVILQVQDSTSTWRNLTAAGGVISGLIYSDGTNLALYNGGGASENVTYIQVAIGG